VARSNGIILLDVALQGLVPGGNASPPQVPAESKSDRPPSAITERSGAAPRRRRPDNGRRAEPLQNRASRISVDRPKLTVDD
jgi:hypothetical protein